MKTTSSTTTNLRDEIARELYAMWVEQDGGYTNAAYGVWDSDIAFTKKDRKYWLTESDRILKLVEKRFDREIQALYRVRSGYDMVAHAQEVLRDFKKEILKK